MALTAYEELLQALVDQGISVDERTLCNLAINIRGVYAEKTGKPPMILIDGRMEEKEKLCVLAEEAGHHFKSYGSALDADDVTQRKNELSGRRWSHEHVLPLERIIKSWKNGNRTVYDLSDDLDVEEDFLRAALDHYHRKHGVVAVCGNWVVQFDPYFTIYQEK